MTNPHPHNLRVIQEFRARRGSTYRLSTNRPILLLTTTGAKTGRAHTTPLNALQMEAYLFIIATPNPGIPHHPDWYHNLVAHPLVTVETQKDTYSAQAFVIDAPARQPIWDHLTHLFPYLIRYQAKVLRALPIIELIRVTPE